MDEGTDNLNILLIGPEAPPQLSFGKAMSRYANVRYHGNTDRTLHRIPGHLAERTSLPKGMIKIVAKVVNTPARLELNEGYYFKADDVDAVVVLGVIKRYDLSVFRNAIKLYWNEDSVYPNNYWNTVINHGVIDNYDIMLIVHRNYLDTFRSMGAKCYRLPYYYDPEINKPMNVRRKYDWCFVGNISNDRKRRIADIKRRLPIMSSFAGRAMQHDMNLVYNQSGAVLNLTQARELNYRNFEALGSGRLLISDYSREASQFFKNGRDIVTAESDREMAELTQYYTEKENKDEAIRIAKRGHDNVSKNHTTYKRAEELLSIIRRNL